MFDYDQSNIRDDQRATLQRNAEFLRRWQSVRVSVEGHADARGTNEYNLALGERRANAVKEYLVGLGIGTDRLVVVSKGEETPVCTEMTEECYKRNRRGHFLITGSRTAKVADLTRSAPYYAVTTITRYDHAAPTLTCGEPGATTTRRPARVQPALRNSSAIASAAARGSRAAMIGRPTTMYVAPAFTASAGPIVRD